MSARDIERSAGTEPEDQDRRTDTAAFRPAYVGG